MMKMEAATGNLIRDNRYSALLESGGSRVHLNSEYELDGLRSRLWWQSKVMLGISLICLTLAVVFFVTAVTLLNSQASLDAEKCTLDSFSLTVQERRAIAASQGKLPYNQRHPINNPSQIIQVLKPSDSSTL